MKVCYFFVLQLIIRWETHYNMLKTTVYNIFLSIISVLKIYTYITSYNFITECGVWSYQGSWKSQIINEPRQAIHKEVLQ